MKIRKLVLVAVPLVFMAACRDNAPVSSPSPATSPKATSRPPVQLDGIVKLVLAGSNAADADGAPRRTARPTASPTPTASATSTTRPKTTSTPNARVTTAGAGIVVEVSDLSSSLRGCGFSEKDNIPIFWTDPTVFDATIANHAKFPGNLPGQRVLVTATLTEVADQCVLVATKIQVGENARISPRPSASATSSSSARPSASASATARATATPTPRATATVRPSSTPTATP